MLVELLKPDITMYERLYSLSLSSKHQEPAHSHESAVLGWEWSYALPFVGALPLLVCFHPETPGSPPLPAAAERSVNAHDPRGETGLFTIKHHSTFINKIT
jgi:hypothetical protein